ncbi:MAG TPA: hypothetical protein VGL23_10885 [Chloroflexota bacterium]|jgi:alkanesulfonate monooxygenase SsuD/methylene tetrahydromethanopterin reductase-like flavin-dependent oxidoreductase (luciferase family)
MASDAPRQSEHSQPVRPSTRFGCTPPTSGSAADAAALRGLAQAAEGLGFESLWVSDHVVIPARIESAYPGGPAEIEARLRWFAERVIGGLRVEGRTPVPPPEPPPSPEPPIPEPDEPAPPPVPGPPPQPHGWPAP